MLSGVWIESVDRLDTLIFNEELSFLEVRRAKEMRNGHLLSQLGAGLYQYQIEGNVLSIRNTASSSSESRDVFINVESDRLVIDDFYRRDSGTSRRLTFEKFK